MCEEIYSIIFAEEFEKNGSINSRGTWVKIDEKFFNKQFLEIGEAALAVISEVRKWKSENNLSMKTTVKKILINSPINLSVIAEDLKNVCNAEEIKLTSGEKFVEVIPFPISNYANE